MQVFQQFSAWPSRKAAYGFDGCSTPTCSLHRRLLCEAKVNRVLIRPLHYFIDKHTRSHRRIFQGVKVRFIIVIKDTDCYNRLLAQTSPSIISSHCEIKLGNPKLKVE